MSRSGVMYSVFADYYDIVVLGWSGAARAAAFYIRNLPFNRDTNLNVLDIGCGTGIYTMEILERFPSARVWAFDRNEAMVGVLRRKLQDHGLENRANTFLSDMVKPLPLPSDTRIDLMIASGALEYGNLPSILNNLLPYVKQNGYFFDAAIQDTFAGMLLAAFWGCKITSRSEILAAFYEAGFTPSSMLQLPSSYIFLRFLKAAYLFKRTG